MSAHVRCSRGHELWRVLIRDGPCPLYGCPGTVEGNGLAGDREPRTPAPAPPPIEVALTPPRLGQPEVDG